MDVAVVGLGPVGATVAALLGAQGVRVVVLERAPRPSLLPRAIALDDEALRVLQAAGLTGASAPPLLSADVVRLRGRHRRLLLELGLAGAPYGHPGLAFVHQPDLEAALRRRLEAQPDVSLRLGVEVSGLDQDRAGVTLRTGTGTGDRVRARYVLGCDGASGVVRRALGVPLWGWSSPRRWLVIDGAPDGGGPAGSLLAAAGVLGAPFTFHADPGRPWVSGPLPAGRRRWEFMLAHGEEPEQVLAPASLARLLEAAGTASSVDIERAAIYTFHSRLAARWRVGRVLLMGDAAHLSPPFAGQGLGAGLRDAANLAWKLAAVLQGRATSSLLDTYAAERRPHVRRMNMLALGLGGALQTRSPTAAIARDTLVTGLLRVPAVASWAHGGGWKPAPRHTRGLIAPGRGIPTDRLHGRLFPQPRVCAATGWSEPLDDVLGPGFAVVGLDVAPADHLGPDARVAVEALAARLLVIRPVDRRPPGPGEVRELDPSVLLAWWRLARGALIILRPDRHAFSVVAAAQVDAGLRSLCAALGLGICPTGR